MTRQGSEPPLTPHTPRPPGRCTRSPGANGTGSATTAGSPSSRPSRPLCAPTSPTAPTGPPTWPPSTPRARPSGTSTAATGCPTRSTTTRSEQVRRGLRRLLGSAPRRPAGPLSVADLRQIITAIDPSTTAGRRDTAVILLGFAGALRRSELAALTLGDLEPMALSSTGRLRARRSRARRVFGSRMASQASARQAPAQLQTQRRQAPPKR